MSPNDADTQVEEILQQLLNRVDNLESKVDKLEREKNQLIEERERMRDSVSAAENNVKNLEQSVEELTESVEDIDSERINTRIDGAYSQIESVQEEIYNNRSDIMEDISSVKSRLSDVEEHTGLSEGGQTISLSQSTIEQLCEFDEDKRLELVNKDLFYATIVWEYFDEWMTNLPISSEMEGYLKAKDIKKFINVKFSDVNISYSYAYRIMKAFDRNSPSRYQYIDHEKHNKCLAKFTDGTKVGGSSKYDIIETDGPDEVF